MYILQPWILKLNIAKSIGMKMLIWIIFKVILKKILNSLYELAQSLSRIHEKYQSNANSVDQKYYIALKIKVPFDLTIRAINPITNYITLIKVDYNNLPISCQYYISTTHFVKD